jgi:uroporphyrinogen decarboxylase
VRKEQDLVRDYIKRMEEVCAASYDAMMDAGIKVILQTDDLGFKGGPLMDPVKMDALFGPSYQRLIKQVHDRGCKFILHSCGNNTRNFPYFIKWGVDGAHALENTAGLDYEVVKGEFGSKLTLIGGVGIDHVLSDRSTDSEVDAAVHQLIQMMAPGGRFIIGNVHSEASVPAAKLRAMLDAVKRHGTYPITPARKKIEADPWPSDEWKDWNTK